MAEEIGACCYLADYLALRGAKTQVALNLREGLVGLSLALLRLGLAGNDSNFAIVKGFIYFSHVFLQQFANIAHFEASPSSHHLHRHDHWLLGSQSEWIGRVQREVMRLFVQRNPRVLSKQSLPLLVEVFRK